VVVRENLRGAGVGTALMADIARWARDNRLVRLQLLADRRNRLALAFYDRLAFQTTNMICLRARSLD
jgi:GNAT superfamily N-acetyltransferase